MKLDPNMIQSALGDLSQGHRQLPVVIEVVAETGSTNMDLMVRAKDGLLTAPVLLLTEKQTAGRGRAGRSWHSTPGGVLTFSLAWHFETGAQSLLGLPLVVGIAIAERLLQIGVPVSLKWPNDILKDGKKLGGILLESQSDGLAGAWAVIGVGLNLQIPTSLERVIGQEVADAPWLAQMDRNDLMAQLLQSLMAAIEEFKVLGFTAFVERWNGLHAHAQQAVRIIDQGKLLHQGIALGVDAQGSLVLQTEIETLRIHSGDVSLRALP
jgi:BirA family biotin operon repressor/biotin-[acetyl-CoA-carboxylase] ligase